HPIRISKLHPTPASALSPYTTLFRSVGRVIGHLIEPAIPLDLVDVAKAVALLDLGDDLRKLQRILRRGPVVVLRIGGGEACSGQDRKSTRLNSSHVKISYAVLCLKKT